MNRKLNAAITAGLSLSMVLSSTPVAAIAAETAQNTSGEAAATGVKTVSFYANGGTFADGSPISMDHKTNENGEINPLKDSPVRDGYVFDGWYYDSTCTQAVDFSQPLQGGAANFMLYAKWTKAPSKVLHVMLPMVAPSPMAMWPWRVSLTATVLRANRLPPRVMATCLPVGIITAMEPTRLISTSRLSVAARM